MEISIKFEPKDLWVGLFWNIKTEYNYRLFPSYKCISKYLYIYICIIPCLPIIIRKKLNK
jgi:hypothetical protein